MNPREEIKDIAPKLSLWKYKEGYTVPKGYFENLSDKMYERVLEEEKLEPYFTSLPNEVMRKIQEEDKGKVISIRPFFKYAIAAAFMFLIGTLVWTNLDGGEPDLLTSIESSDDLDYIIESVSIEDIFDSEFFDNEILDEVLANEEYETQLNDSAEDFLFDADDELLEEFL